MLKLEDWDEFGHIIRKENERSQKRFLMGKFIMQGQ